MIVSGKLSCYRTGRSHRKRLHQHPCSFVTSRLDLAAFSAFHCCMETVVLVDAVAFSSRISLVRSSGNPVVVSTALNASCPSRTFFASLALHFSSSSERIWGSPWSMVLLNWVSSLFRTLKMKSFSLQVPDIRLGAFDYACGKAVAEQSVNAKQTGHDVLHGWIR